MQHKDHFETIENDTSFKEHTCSLCCDITQLENSLSHTSFAKVRQELLEEGMSEDDFEELMGFLKALARRVTDKDFNITNDNNTDGYE